MQWWEYVVSIAAVIAFGILMVLLYLGTFKWRKTRKDNERL